MEPFDTVKDTKAFLGGNPDPDEVAELLEAEKEGRNRVTAVSALEGYLEEYDSDSIEFRVQRPFDDHEVGDIIELDPDDNWTQTLRRDGRIQIW